MTTSKETSTETRISGVQLLLVWIGGIISIPSLLIGGLLVPGLTIGSAMLASFIGYAIVSTYMGLESVAAARLRVPTVRLAARSFGMRGAEIVVGLVVGVASLGWFGIWCKLSGASIAAIFAEQFGMSTGVLLPGVVFGVLMVGIAAVGIKYLKYLNYVAVPCKVLLLLYMLWVVLSEHSTSEIWAYQPPTSGSFIGAIALAIGFFAVGGVVSPDYARYARTEKDAFFGSVLGLLPAALLMTFIGCVLSILLKNTDLVKMFQNLGYPVLALTFFVIAIWPLNAMNAYSAGLAINQTFRMPEESRPMVTAVAGMVGIILGVSGLLDDLQGFLTLLASMIPPVAGVIVAEYWFARGKYKFDASNSVLYWPGPVAWALGVGMNLLFEAPIKQVASILLSAVAYLVLSAIARSASSRQQPV